MRKPPKDGGAADSHFGTAAFRPKQCVLQNKQEVKEKKRRGAGGGIGSSNPASRSLRGTETKEARRSGACGPR